MKPPKFLARCAMVALVALYGAMAAATDMPGGPRDYQMNLGDPVTHIARDQHWIHSFMLLVSLAIFVAVFAVMFYAIWKHRKSRGHQSATFHESTAVEIAWTVVPFLIIIAMAIPATRMVLEQKDTSNSDLTVKVTGYQWKWGYEYIKGEGEGISFMSALATPRAQIENREAKSPTYLSEVDNPLVVPVNMKVRVITTANDVIHSWYVPPLGVKQDAIPGFVRDTWFRAEKVGTFHGYCAELCGKDHAFMPIVVEVKSAADYSKWVEERHKAMLAAADDPNKNWTKEELVERGEQVFTANCAACHQANGKGIPGAFPALDGSKVVLGPAAGQMTVLLNGRAGTAMASWRRLSDVELAAVTTYTRNAWSNHAEQGLVLPKEYGAARK